MAKGQTKKHQEIEDICKNRFNNIFTVDKNTIINSYHDMFIAVYHRDRVIPWKNENIEFMTSKEKLKRYSYGGCKQYEIDTGFISFMKKAKEKFGDKYSFCKSEFVNIETNIEIICPIHGSFYKRPDHFLSSDYGCQKCANHNEERLKEYKNKFIKKARVKFGKNFIYNLNNFKTQKSKIEVECIKHNCKFTIPAYLHLKNKNGGCILCQKENENEARKRYMPILWRKNSYNINKIKDNMLEKYSNDFEFPDKIIHQSQPTTVVCKKCGGIFKYKPSYILFSKRYLRCPICGRKNSVLEEYVFNKLKEHFQYIERKKRFSWLRNENNRTLELDIFLPEHNIAVECQGKQHFTEVRFNKRYTDEEICDRLEKQIINDTIKYKLCKQHGIQVLYYSDYKEIDNDYMGVGCINNIDALLKKIKETIYL